MELRRRGNGAQIGGRWFVEEMDACFVVKDGSGRQLACVYFEDGPGWRSAAKLLSKDEARRRLMRNPWPMSGIPPKGPQ
jgi:hypothetical protein